VYLCAINRLPALCQLLLSPGWNKSWDSAQNIPERILVNDALISGSKKRKIIIVNNLISKHKKKNTY